MICFETNVMQVSFVLLSPVLSPILQVPSPLLTGAATRMRSPWTWQVCCKASKRYQCQELKPMPLWCTSKALDDIPAHICSQSRGCQQGTKTMRRPKKPIHTFRVVFCVCVYDVNFVTTWVREGEEGLSIWTCTYSPKSCIHCPSVQAARVPKKVNQPFIHQWYVTFISGVLT